MFVDRELAWKHAQDIMRVEEAKAKVDSHDPTWLDHLELLDAQKAAEASDRARKERGMQVERGRSPAAVARLQQEHDREYFRISSGQS